MGCVPHTFRCLETGTLTQHICTACRHLVFYLLARRKRNIIVKKQVQSNVFTPDHAGLLHESDA